MLGQRLGMVLFMVTSADHVLTTRSLIVHVVFKSPLTTAVQSQNAVSAHFTSEHILPLQILQRV